MNKQAFNPVTFNHLRGEAAYLRREVSEIGRIVVMLGNIYAGSANKGGPAQEVKADLQAHADELASQASLLELQADRLESIASRKAGEGRPDGS